ncbi:MAG: ribonuclease P protein component [Eubacteriales bacterium]|nr:ribonuclease P protein component [Eubacteriales bacterium]MDD4324107.1 ribonuclease P protein component [Eubacteriales bacterium]
MPTYEKLKRNIDFTRVYRRGQHHSGRYLVLHAFQRKATERDSVSRVGFTVAKKIRSSVDRNRMKRLLRETFRLSAINLRSGYDIIVTARWQDSEPDQEALRKELLYLLRKLELIEER